MPSKDGNFPQNGICPECLLQRWECCVRSHWRSYICCCPGTRQSNLAGRGRWSPGLSVQSVGKRKKVHEDFGSKNSHYKTFGKLLKINENITEMVIQQYPSTTKSQRRKEFDQKILIPFLSSYNIFNFSYRKFNRRYCSYSLTRKTTLIENIVQYDYWKKCAIEANFQVSRSIFLWKSTGLSRLLILRLTTETWFRDRFWTFSKFSR